MNITDHIATGASGWDEVGDLDIQLYGATLQVDTPQFKKGTKVDTIAFLFSTSTCVIYDKDGNEVDKFLIKLSLNL